MNIICSKLAVIAMLLTTSMNADYYGQNNSNDDNTYEGSSGRTYQYDMSDSSQQRDYQYDYDAQRRDSMDLDVGGNRARDESLGQYGGGVYDD